MLAGHQDVQDKLAMEIEKAFAAVGEKNVEHKEEASAFLDTDELNPAQRRVTFDMLKEMPYLDGVVFEALRLFPPVAFDPKQAVRDDVLPNGIKVPKGTVIVYEQ